MPTYIAFLRAINLGATRKFPKADIVRAVESAGFTDIETHINTGNVRFATRMRSRERIETALEAAFAADRGFEVPTIVYTLAQVAAIAADLASLAAQHPDAQRHYVDLLRTEPTGKLAAQIEAASSDAARLVVTGRAVHTLLAPGTSLAGAPVPGIAKLLGVATNRNATVITAIAARWC